jgi:hypothetical protein
MEKLSLTSPLAPLLEERGVVIVLLLPKTSLSPSPEKERKLLRFFCLHYFHKPLSHRERGGGEG